MRPVWGDHSYPVVAGIGELEVAIGALYDIAHVRQPRFNCQGHHRWRSRLPLPWRHNTRTSNFPYATVLKICDHPVAIGVETQSDPFKRKTSLGSAPSGSKR
jgi:hypothetical protein